MLALDRSPVVGLHSEYIPSAMAARGTEAGGWAILRHGSGHSYEDIYLMISLDLSVTFALTFNYIKYEVPVYYSCKLYMSVSDLTFEVVHLERPSFDLKLQRLCTWWMWTSSLLFYRPVRRLPWNDTGQWFLQWCNARSGNFQMSQQEAVCLNLDNWKKDYTAIIFTIQTKEISFWEKQ